MIIDYINSHQYCGKNTVAHALQDYMAKKTVLKLIDELQSDGIIDNKKNLNKPKGTRHPLVVNNSNILLQVPVEIEEFETLFISFLQENMRKTAVHTTDLCPVITHIFLSHKKELKKKDDEKLSIAEVGDIIRTDSNLRYLVDGLGTFLSMIVKSIEIFREFVQIYTIRAVIEWPDKVADKNLLNKLITQTFAKISTIQVKFIEIISSSIPLVDPIGLQVTEGRFFDVNKSLLDILAGESRRKEILDYYKYFEVEKDIEPVINYLYKISKNMDVERNKYLPLKEWGLHDVSEWNAETLRTVSGEGKNR